MHNKLPPRQCGLCPGGHPNIGDPFRSHSGRFGRCEVSAGVATRTLPPGAHDQAIDADPRPQSHGAHVILGDPHRGVEAGRVVGKNLDSDVGSGTGSHNETPKSPRTVRSPRDPEEITAFHPVDTGEVTRQPPTPKDAMTPTTLHRARSRLGVVLLLVGTGLLMQGAADALARAGHASPALPLFLCAISLLFGACAWRLTSAHAGRRERVSVSLALGLGLLASYVMHQPLQLDSFDELIHVGTLVQLLDTHTLFPTNTILPVSPYYPGLELATAATRWLTGLPLVVDELVVLAAVRIVLVLAVFLVVERACHSSVVRAVSACSSTQPVRSSMDSMPSTPTRRSPSPSQWRWSISSSSRSMPIDPRWGDHSRSRSVASWRWSSATMSPAGSPSASWSLGPQRCTSRPTPSVAPRPSTTVTSQRPRRGSLRRRPRNRRMGRPSRPHWRPTVSSSEEEDPGRYRRHFGRGRPTRRRCLDRLRQSSACPVFGSRLFGRGHRNQPGFGQRSWKPSVFQSAARRGFPRLGDRLDSGGRDRLVRAPRPLALQRDFRRSVRGGVLRYFPAVIAAIFPISLLADISTASKAVADRRHVHLLWRRIGRCRVAGEKDLTVPSDDRAGRHDRRSNSHLCGQPDPRLWSGCESLARALRRRRRQPVLRLTLAGHGALGRHPCSGRLSRCCRPRQHRAAQRHRRGSPVRSGTEKSIRKPSTSTIRSPRLTSMSSGRTTSATSSWTTASPRGARSTEPISQRANRRSVSPWRNSTKFNSYPQIKRVYDNGSIQVYDTTELLAQRPAALPPAGAPGGRDRIRRLHLRLCPRWSRCRGC